jgi:transcription elongation GreA/GreB family factor
MSRGFVKEDDLEHAGTDLPERPISTDPNYVTPAGLQQLNVQAEALDQERILYIAKKEDAIAKQKLAMIDRDLRYLSSRIEQAILVSPSNQVKDTVLFGSHVLVEDEEGQQHTFYIVGEDEADISLNKVSWVSPLAKALIGHIVGENVLWKRPAGNMQLEIFAINY